MISGTSAELLQSSLDGNWWADSLECYLRYLRNVQDLLSYAKTSYDPRLFFLLDRQLTDLCDISVKTPPVW